MGITWLNDAAPNPKNGFSDINLIDSLNIKNLEVLLKLSKTFISKLIRYFIDKYETKKVRNNIKYFFLFLIINKVKTSIAIKPFLDPVSNIKARVIKLKITRKKKSNFFLLFSKL